MYSNEEKEKWSVNKWKEISEVLIPVYSKEKHKC